MVNVVLAAPSNSIVMNTPPASLQVSHVAFLIRKKRQVLPLFLVKLAAGFPSPAEEFLDKPIDLNEHLAPHPASTFYVRVAGDSMHDAGIRSGDLLIVDRSLPVRNDAVVVAVLNGEFTVKYLRKDGHRLFLLPANQDYTPIEVTEDMDFTVWGVATSVIHPF